MLIKNFIKIAPLFSLIGANYAQSAAISGTCKPYPANATCSNYINHNVYIPADVTMLEIETKLQELANISTLIAPISPVCFDTLARYECAKVYPKCVTDNSSNTADVYSVCKSSCEKVNIACTKLIEMTEYRSLLPNCSTEATPTGIPLQPDGFCSNISTKSTEKQIENGVLNLAVVSTDTNHDECPAPFLKDPLAVRGTNATVDSNRCRFGCCVPCPSQDYFYKEHWAENGFKATGIVRLISSVLSFFMVISYLILPDKRRHPSLLILNFSASIFLFSMVIFFSIGDPKRIQCASNGISVATIENNTLCAVQGAILIFASYATCLWCAALILNLHVQTVWNSNFFNNKYIFLSVICWGIPAIAMAIAIGLHAIKFEFANMCLISTDYIFPLFFYPLIAIVCPSFIIHTATFFYIARIAVREGVESDMTQSLSTPSERAPGVSRKHVMVAVKIQWRALLIAVVAIVTVLLYWSFYITQVKKMTDLKNNAELKLEWFECMMTPGKTQDICADLVSDHLPLFSLIILAETLGSMIGIFVFVTFAKRSLWREWNDWIYNVRMKIGITDRSGKIGEQFFTL